MLSAVRTAAPPFDLAVCVIVRNEGVRILEWLFYHYLLGFQHFYVYDNDSTDGLRERLAPFVARGVVTLTPWPGRGFPGPQRRQIAHCLNTTNSTARWVGVFDVDEYVVYNRAAKPSRKAFSTLFTKMEASQHGAIIAPRFVFDSDGHDTPPPELTVRAYTRCNAVQSKRGKAFILTRAFVKMKGFHNVAVLPGWKIARRDRGLEIFHYQYRSRQECLLKAADDHKANLGDDGRPDPSRMNWRLKKGAAFCDSPLQSPVMDRTLAEAPITGCVEQLIAAVTSR